MRIRHPFGWLLGVVQTDDGSISWPGLWLAYLTQCTIHAPCSYGQMETALCVSKLQKLYLRDTSEGYIFTFNIRDCLK